MPKRQGSSINTPIDDPIILEGVQVIAAKKVEVKFPKNVKVDGILDSGAEANVINQQTVNQLGLQKYCTALSHKRLVVASGKSLVVDTQIAIPITCWLGGKRCDYWFTAIVAKGVRKELYLGMPFISRFHKVITFQSYSPKILKRPQINEVSVKTQENSISSVVDRAVSLDDQHIVLDKAVSQDVQQSVVDRAVSLDDQHLVVDKAVSQDVQQLDTIKPKGVVNQEEEIQSRVLDTLPQEQLVIGKTEFCRLAKKNQIGLLLLDEIVTQQQHEISIDTVDIEVPLTGVDEQKDRLLEEFSDVVTNEEPTILPPQRSVDHRITFLDEKKVVARRQYRLSHVEVEELVSQVAKLQAKGFITPSASPFNSPVLFVKKKDGTFRLCVDFRLLNEATIKDRFPLPLIDDILDRVSSAQVFSKLDLMSGYYQIRVKEEDRAKTAFSTPYGHYEWTVMPFGLTNAPATFQGFMNTVFAPLLNRCVMVYLDDIVVYSDNLNDHFDDLRKVLQLLRDNQLIAKEKKCAFFMKQITFLGFVVSNKGVHTDPGKVKAVVEWPQPQTPKDAQRFLGLTGFYQRFIPHYASTVKDLQEFATQKCEWSVDQDQAFKLIKEKMVSAPVLISPCFEDGYQFRVTTDASHYCLGFVLEQLDPKGKLMGIISYGSKKLTGAELNYPVREKEFYAVIKALEKFRSYLMYRHFIIRTDHHSLIYLKQNNIFTGRLARWIAKISVFDFDITYLPGNKNSAADALSRPPIIEDNGSIDAEEIFLDEQMVMEMTPNLEMKDALAQLYADDPDFGEIYTVLLNKLPIPKKINHYINHFQLEDKLLYYSSLDGGELESFERICIPAGDWRTKLMNQCHADSPGGHVGSFKTFELLARGFFWPKMLHSVKKFIKHCDRCQRIKPQRAAVQGLFKPLEIPEGRWTDVTLDFVGALPETEDGFDTVLVVVDRFSKRAHFIPTKKELSAEESAELFMNNIFKLHGVPKRLVSDKDVRFTATFWRTIQAKLGTSVIFTTTNHPQSDGQSERTIQTLIHLLRGYVSNEMNQWDKYLYMAEFAYNSTYHTSIKEVPFKVDLGYIPDGPAYVSGMSIERFSPRAEELANRLKAIQIRIQDELVEFNRKTEARDNSSRRIADYQVGDWVLINKDALSFAVSQAYNKIHPVYFGPYRLVKKLNDNAYEVDLPVFTRKHRTINTQWFRKYHGTDSGYPKVPPKTDLEVSARINEMVGIAGYDYENKKVIVFWKDCQPGLGSAITYDQFYSAKTTLQETLIDRARNLL